MISFSLSPVMPKAAPPQGRHEAQCSDLFRNRNAAGEQQAGQAGAECEPARVSDLQRQPQQGCVGYADGAHQREELGVGADEDVLPVVELVALRDHSPGAAAGQRAGLEHGRGDAALGKRDGGGHPGITGPHDGNTRGYAVTQVFHAIQNFRSGVSDVLRVRTWKPSRSISPSSVR